MYVYTYLYIIMHKKFFTEFLFPIFIVCVFYCVSSFTLTYTNVLQLKYYKSRFNYDICNQESHLKSLNRAISFLRSAIHPKNRIISVAQQLERMHREDFCSWKGSSADFGRLRAIIAKINIDCWCKRANNASNCREGPLI